MIEKMCLSRHLLSSIFRFILICSFLVVISLVDLVGTDEYLQGPLTPILPLQSENILSKQVVKNNTSSEEKNSIMHVILSKKYKL